MTSLSNQADPRGVGRVQTRGGGATAVQSVQTAISGTYPMLYAFFGAEGDVLREPFARQIAAAIAAGAAGIAVLGLGIEVGKLSRAEQRQIVEWVVADLSGRLPLAVTVAGGPVAEMIGDARFAEQAGAGWLILQPPRPPISGAQLVAYFGRVAASVSCPVAIQNAPDFLGVGLSAAELLALHRAHPNVSVVKAESSAVAVASLIGALGPEKAVFNGRAGMELTDNYRAGVAGMIPGTETIDLQVAVARAMAQGDEPAAESHYRRLLPITAFIMQGLSHFVLYGKLIAGHRLGLAASHLRLPSDIPTPQGLRWARRLADDLGPLAP